jgi:dTDP-4-dehydrorhamnose reductase
MRVLVTGANGMLGQDLCRMLEEAGHTAIRTGVSVREGAEIPEWQALDITDTQAVMQCIEKNKPDAVFHGAAYTDVDGCERNPDMAFKINELGTWNIAAACAEHDIRMTYISTDFVFDGAKKTPYCERDATNPLGYYGWSKLAGERHVAALCRKHYIVRTAWLFGVNGPSFPRKMLELAQTRPEIRVVVDQVGSPTHTVDLARTLINLLETPLYGTYHVTSKGSCSWYDFCRKTLELAGVTGVAVKAMPADEWPSPTKRPAYSVLRHYALELQGRDDLPEWEDALADFLKRIGK